MGKLIAVIGNCGSGKTVLTKRLSEHFGLAALLEQHQERPFQAKFQSDLRSYALANQVDYLLYRAEQEFALRGSHTTGIADGGLEQDFHVFTKLFHRKGLLDDREYGLCERLYVAMRTALPPPDIIIRLTAPLEVLLRRRANRTRELDIITDEDLPAIEELIGAWLRDNSIPLIAFDTRADDPDYSTTTATLFATLDRYLAGR